MGPTASHSPFKPSAAGHVGVEAWHQEAACAPAGKLRSASARLRSELTAAPGPCAAMGEEDYYLELCERPVQFEKANPVNCVFFDEANKQVGPPALPASGPGWSRDLRAAWGGAAPPPSLAAHPGLDRARLRTRASPLVLGLVRQPVCPGLLLSFFVMAAAAQGGDVGVCVFLEILQKEETVV